jgi:hypothetical protein
LGLISSAKRGFISTRKEGGGLFSTPPVESFKAFGFEKVRVHSAQFKINLISSGKKYFELLREKSNIEEIKSKLFIICY